MPAVETKPDLDALIRKVEKMSPMGNTVQKALSILNDASFDAVRLAGVMRLDETMTGMVLRLANSAYYAPAQRISDITRAVAYLGQSNVKQLLLSASVSYLVRRPLPGYGFGRGELWTHAVGVAAGARYLAAPLGHSMAESAYTAGLLADIGMLALDSLLQERSIPNLNVRAAPTLELEREYLGVDHATLGAEIANRWNLPPLIVEAIAHHHRPTQARAAAKIAAAVHIADVCLVKNGIGAGQDTSAYTPEAEALALINCSENHYNTLYEMILPLIQSAKAAVGA
jgi:putative nucleotidyltransferase with HDIG domain